MTTMRYMHLSPAAKDTAVQALDNRDAALKKQQDAAAPGENAGARMEKFRRRGSKEVGDPGQLPEFP
jgi:hypothetical protein